MSKKKAHSQSIIAEGLNPDTRLRVVKTFNGTQTEKIMTVAEWREFKKQFGATYIAYQI